MTNQQLFIDGQLMDLSENTSITLDIKSNLFRDVTKMTANNTYTIQLPKTVHNMTVMELSARPTAVTKYPYIFHDVRYLRNGLEIIKEGRATVLSIGETIEISIYWGIYPALSKLKESDLKLNELETDERLLFVEANNTADRQTAIQQGVFYADYISEQIDDSDSEAWAGTYNDITEDGEITNTHKWDIYAYRKKYYRQPCVTCGWLLELIATNTGVRFEFPNTESQYIEELVIPLVSNKADDKTITGKIDAEFVKQASTGEMSFTLNDSISSVSEQKGATTNILNVTKDCTLSFDVQMKYSWDVEHGGWGQPDTGGSGSPDDDIDRPDYENSKQVFPYYIEMNIEHYSVTGDGETEKYTVGNAFYDDGTRKSYLVYEKEAVNGRCYRLITGSGKLELKRFDKITFTLKNEGGTLYDTQMYDSFFTIGINIGDEVPIGGLFPIGINLPEITVIDFIRFLSVILGVFPKQVTNSEKVTFVHYDDVLGMRDNAVDWSRKLIPSSNSNIPRKTEFSYSDYKQVNHYKWKEDEQTKGNYDADFLVDNKTLEYEQDVWTFPFAASDGNRIPIRTPYSKTGDNEKGGEYKGCNDRIVNLTNDEKATLSFDIDLKKIFETKYDKLAKSLSRAHIVTERFNLSDLEILTFDETKPVYLAQYCCYFAVLEIKTTDNGYCEVQMIEIV